MRVLPCADSGLLVELDDLDQVRALHAALEADPPEGVTDFVPAARTLLLRLDPAAADMAGIEQAVRSVRPGEVSTRESELLRIPVVYDGADLEEVAILTGLTEREVVEEHTGTEWTVAFGGFAPGFGYLTGGSPRLEVPRRAESRTRVPVGAVGLAGTFSGVYPRESPGGWQLIGRTELRMWDVDRDPPALLRPGVRVRFEEAE
ncbi:allophanate hydrolase [Prauserella sp. PE36]|uniref:Allophanate hydrolase subunit 1 n=1 Tax=Prauserella endophytica TaxID=1592324 RepID=A0ABY2RYW7_9PSEU|nr:MULTISPECIES: allophanate hydrolase subunit 1 [Prauserella]PXY19968.1 allophanate hydrolase [Prauserella coralliicola]RBM18510.1 allophanate hydrolase [Prauserella sp. PE36]TKG64293.1 allophanate hydrolase subunit 1 [Prauserella endophytica]